MDPWYRTVTPRQEVREGRSFNPDEFAIALEQVVAGTAPADYRDPAKFLARTCFTSALRDHAGMVLRRLAGETSHTAPVLTLITQFGGGKTHTLTALYHIARTGVEAVAFPGVAALLEVAGLTVVPQARVGVFVGNAWDPQAGRETPWLDLARQLAGDAGVEALGSTAQTIPPGTEALGRLFAAAGGGVLLLFDEVLNFVNRHRGLAEPFYAFLQNLTVAMTGTTRGAAVISLPRSQVEMTDWDLQWQERIIKVVRRVAKDLIANDEAEIGEVVRRRLFENLGPERNQKRVAKMFADWCFERRAQLSPEWTAVDTATTEAKARELLQSRFEACYPFHPATLSVFQRKWQALPQYQQTRGTLAMLAQWISWAYRNGFTHARREPLITLGSAPLEGREFRGIVLGQLGESRLVAALDADIAGAQAHARVLDVDTRGALRDVHRRVGTAILFESSGGQIDKVAHLPELRFALGEPDVDTTSVDTAALALEARAYYLRRVGSDGFQIRHQPTLKKVVSDRRASLDEISEIRPAMHTLVKDEFDRGRTLPVFLFRLDGDALPDSPRLTLVVMEPETEWKGEDALRRHSRASGLSGLRERLATWTRRRGTSPRLYPGALVWCVKKPGWEYRDKVELALAWKRVQGEIEQGTLGGDFDRTECAEVLSKVKEAQEEAQDEVWASYRYVILADNQEPDGLRVIDLGAGHASASETLCGRVISALKSQALLNETVGAGYLERRWPPALKEVGAWPLASLRQSFLNGALTRLMDPDTVLRHKIVEFVGQGDFGLASVHRPDGTYDRLWYGEAIAPEEVTFEADVFLLMKAKAQALKVKAEPMPTPVPPPESRPQPLPWSESGSSPEAIPGPVPASHNHILHLVGTIPPEVWNRLGTKVLPKLRMGNDLRVDVDLSVRLHPELVRSMVSDLRQILQDLDLEDRLRIEQDEGV